jgi:ribosomal peptide maturation radical SAM protein 1
MRLLLVNMPWQWLQMPSISLGILRARINDTCPGVDVDDYYANLAWADYLLAESDGELDAAMYSDIADAGMFHGIGDWVFASALYDDDDWRAREFDAYIAGEGLHELGAMAHRCRGYARSFVDVATQRILDREPDVVGFTTSFSQTVPALSVARRLKVARPSLVTVLGGSNCEDTMGAALHRNFPFIDYVVRGEGELSFPRLVTAIGSREGDEALAAIPGLCWRPSGDASGSTANPMPRAIVPIGEIPAPDYSGWAEEFDNSVASEYVEPRLLVETSRGCWWGETHHCTFCGLNGSFMKFRVKSAERIWAEIERLVTTHQILDVVTVDNIMDMGLLGTLLPMMEAADWDLRVHYEVKANLKPAALDRIARAGVVHVQPGIESLSTRVLELMRKGVHGTQNVRLLRDAEERSLTVSWNYLYGFPGELDEDYEQALAQLPNLFHLQPPNFATRQTLERFSPYFVDRSLGFTPRSAARHYYHLYDLPDDELFDLAYAFDAEPLGITGEVASRLEEAVAGWRKAYETSTLVMRQVDGAIVIHDRRSGRLPEDYAIEHPAFVEAFHELSRPCGESAFLRALDERLGPGDPDGADWLAGLKDAGLVFWDAGRVVALPTNESALRVRSVVDP